MDSAFTYLSSSAVENDLRSILDEKQIINLWCCQEKKKRQNSFKDALEYKNQLFFTSEISDRIFCFFRYNFLFSFHYLSP